jgi:hypothetical protein
VSEFAGTTTIGVSTASLPNAVEGVSTEPLHVAVEHRATACIASRARALRLSQELGVTVTVDASGGLKDAVELQYRRVRGGTILPLLVRVGKDASDPRVLANGGVLARCREYKEAIDQLRQLGVQLAELMRDGRVQLAPGSAVASAEAELAQLDATIAHRQAIRMGLGTVRLDILSEEIAYFRTRGAELAPIVHEAERSRSAAWDGDTEDIALDGGCDR